VRPRDPYVAWVVASVAAGALVALLINFVDSPLLRVMFLAVVPALILSPIVAMFDGNPVLWIATTLLGVGITFVTTYVTFVLLFVGLGALMPTLAPGTRSAPDWTLPIIGALACFIGALPLGVLQRYALPAVRGAWSFPLATMLGAAALSPLVLSIIGAPLESTLLVGALGGLGYGLATATALARAYSAGHHLAQPGTDTTTAQY
jgi:hypothetical protein